MSQPNVPEIRPHAETEKPAFDWRHVLENLHFGWPDDVVAEAHAMRLAELNQAAR